VSPTGTRPRGPFGALLLTLVVASLVLLAPTAQAACGPHLHRDAARNLVGGKRPPFVIGDSVLAGAMPQVSRAGFEADAQCARQKGTGFAMVARRLHAGTLPRMVVWALGTNGPQTFADIARLRRMIGSTRVLVVVTPRGPVPWTGSTAAAYRKAAARWRNVVAADWARYSSGRRSWLAPDGIHLQAAGAAGYARLLRSMLRHYPQPAPPAKPIAPFVPIPAPPAPDGSTVGDAAHSRVSRSSSHASADHRPRVVPPPAALGTLVKVGCGGTQTRPPTRRRTPGRAPLVIGDSVLLGAMPQAARAGYAVNAHGCRQIGEGLSVIRDHARAGTLPRLIVIQLGTNGTVGPTHLRRALSLLGTGRTLGLLTPRAAGGADTGSGRAMRAFARRHPDRVRLVDWQRETRGRGGWFQPDGIHLTPSGAAGLARALGRLLPAAQPAPADPPAWQPIPAPRPPRVHDLRGPDH
jgi:lysophospholipase L1-like esterase